MTTPRGLPYQTSSRHLFDAESRLPPAPIKIGYCLVNALESRLQRYRFAQVRRRDVALPQRSVYPRQVEVCLRVLRLDRDSRSEVGEGRHWLPSLREHRPSRVEWLRLVGVKLYAPRQVVNAKSHSPIIA